ncbi:MAG: hypothetical protein PVF37_21065, partial [Desulfobacterales bacterium]
RKSFFQTRPRSNPWRQQGKAAIAIVQKRPDPQPTNNSINDLSIPITMSIMYFKFGKREF